jgi:hypothetical protein
MNPWQATFFGLKQIPRELTAFEIEAFFTFTTTDVSWNRFEWWGL